MKLLALDSSGLVASAAVMEDDTLIAEYTINHKKTHSQTLLPMLDKIKHLIDLAIKTIDAVAVAAGPGSFTGLRIGSATAKGIALARNIPIIPVPTVDALAYNLYGTEKIICPIMDARRNQVYTGLYTFESVQETAVPDTLVSLLPQCALDIVEICEKINALGRAVVFLGDGVPVYQQQIKNYMKMPYHFAPASCNRQRAANVAALGACLYAKGVYQTAAEHAPEYLRQSQAERERNGSKNHKV